MLRKGIDALERVSGSRPRGYRSPYWDFSPNTLDLLEELEFAWDSSLMGNDFTPTTLRRVIQDDWVQHGQFSVGNGPSRFSDPSPVMEIPVSWYLDDFPAQEYVTGIQEGMGPVEHIEAR